LDMSRVPDEGKKLLDMYARDFNKHFPTGSHGFNPVDVPSGIKIVQEVARHSDEPWLKVDKPWEDNIGAPGVMFDEGRYRCWYYVAVKGEQVKLTFDQGRGMEIGGASLAYAESNDGWNWTKPKRNTKLSGDTNLLTPYCNSGIVFRDDHGPAEERYK